MDASGSNERKKMKIGMRIHFLRLNSSSSSTEENVSFSLSLSDSSFLHLSTLDTKRMMKRKQDPGVTACCYFGGKNKFCWKDQIARSDRISLWKLIQSILTRMDQIGRWADGKLEWWPTLSIKVMNVFTRTLIRRGVINHWLNPRQDPGPHVQQPLLMCFSPESRLLLFFLLPTGIPDVFFFFFFDPGVYKKYTHKHF